jgi:O-antigen/teichoic acid export membrane protein
VRLQTILRNIFSTWVGYLITLLVGFLLAPFVVHRLGNTGYGIWTLVVSLTGYFGMLDLGLRQSVGRSVARYVALDDKENVNSTVSSALGMLGGAGLLALLATVAIYFSFGIFRIDHQLESTARVALLVAGLNIALVLPFAVFSAVLVALERFDVINGITICGALTRAALVIMFLNLGHGVITLALLTLAVSVSEYSAMAVCAKLLYRPLRPRWSFVAPSRCKELFTFGIYRFIWIVANQLIFYTDSVVIGIFLNAGAITYYAIAGSLINYGRNVVSLATDTLYPTATRLDAKNDMAGLRELQIFGTTIGLLIGLPICVGYVFLGQQFITLWMGAGFSLSAAILIVLTIPQFISMAQYISSLILVGMAKHQALAFIALAEGVANLILSIILIRKIGVIGVAWGTVIPHLISVGLVVPLYTLRTLRMRWTDYIVSACLRPVSCAIPVAAIAYLFSIWVERPSWLGFAAEVAFICGIFLILSYLVCFTAGQRAALRGKARRYLHREPAVVQG